MCTTALLPSPAVTGTAAAAWKHSNTHNVPFILGMMNVNSNTHLAGYGASVYRNLNCYDGQVDR